MSNKEDTDIHKPDGTIFRGDKVGHGDRRSRIRRRDGVIFRGEEIGYVDRDKQVRRPDGFIFKGEAVGQIKGTAAHAKDGIIFSGEEWGYVDDDGNIRQKDGVFFRGRIIGKMRGHNKEAALGFFVLRFKNLVDRFERLESEARHSDDKRKYLGQVRHMLGYVPEYEGLGDFDNLINRLKRLESDLVRDIEGKQRSRASEKEALIREAERWSYSSEWKAAGAELKSLQGRWKSIGSAGDQEESLWERFRSAGNRFHERRTAHFEELDRQRTRNASRKSEICSHAESLRYSSNLKAAAEEVKSLQHQWKEIGPAGKDRDEELWQRFRHACDAIFSAVRDERERKHEEWERKQQEWRDKMHDVLRAKREQASRLRSSIDHDESNISRWRDTIYNLRPGGRADEIRDSLESKIADVEDRVRSKESKLREIEDDIQDIEAKLR